MEVIIGKEKNTLFEQGAVYDCVMKDRGNEILHYKVYGDEFSLSCTDKEFKQNFVLIQADRVGYFDFLRKYVTMKCVKKRRKADGTYILYRSY